MATPDPKPSISPSPIPKIVTSAPKGSPVRHHRLRWTLLSIGGIVAVILIVGGWVFFRAIASVNTLDNSNHKVGIIQQLTHIVTAGNNQLNGEADDRVNILLMGYGGPGHDGPYLTDTLMLVSYKPSTKQIAMLSIPRDLVVSIGGSTNYQKINSVLTVGKNQNYPGGGELLTVKVVSDLLNVPIQYYARVDFSGFEQIIDRLGGVDVTVDNAFTDYSYPTENYGYQTIKFKVGPQTMDGATALKFARSRHGNNGEGSDFARAKRQQKILVGIKEKVLSLGTVLNPVKLSDIIKTLGAHSQTNLEVWEMLRLGNIAKDITPDHIINRVFDDGAKNMLRSATGTGGAYILVPRTGTYDDMKFFATHIFTMGQADTEQAPIAVINASRIPTLGATVASSLGSFALTVTKTQTSSRLYGQTVIIDTTGGSDPGTAKILADYGHTTKIVTPTQWVDAGGDIGLMKLLEPPAANTNSTVVTPKFIFVLGTNQVAPAKPIFTFNRAATTTTNKNTNTSTNKNKNTNTKVTNKNTNTKTTANTNAANTNTAPNTTVNTNAAADTTSSTNTNS